MKVSYQWLSQYVELTGFSGEELAEKLTRSGIEVDVVENRNKGVEKVVVGRVTEREKHPDADKLSVCKVDTGAGELLQIVCGAPNVAAGQLVPVAVVGAQLPDGFKIKKAKLRGVESQGMICSAKELGLNDKLLPKEIQEGILTLPEQVSIGDDAVDVLGIRDEVLELDLTPNRSDCLSMIGVAYEIAAILGREVKLPEPAEGIAPSETKVSDYVQVGISAPEQCQHYSAMLIEGVRIGPSPLWMQNRLMAAGIRPINNAVDITNYVMLEYGQPLHAFDADKLSGGRIEARLAREGEKLVTLDGVERALEPHMLVIADGEKPVALAGVMGGADTEVTPGTTRILLESARFAGPAVRRTSRQLGLRSESSLRFEKEVNPEGVLPALQRAASLMCQLAGGRAAEGAAEAKTGQMESVRLTLTVERVNGYLGTSLSAEEIIGIFQRLNFQCETSPDGALQATVPARRGDIARDVDLIEEVARLYGYDNIPTTLMSGVTTAGSLTRPQRIRRQLRELLTGSGLHEAITYTFTHPVLNGSLPGAAPDAPLIRLSMPMSEERSVLRTSLLPHLIEAAVYNRNRNMDDVALFELGRIFMGTEETLTRLPEEKQMLAILLTGARQQAHWSGKGEPVDFYDLKGLVDSILQVLGIEGAEYLPVQPEGYHPGRTAELRVRTGEAEVTIGRLGQLHPDLQKDKDLGDTYAAELDLEALVRAADFAISYEALPRYPSIVRDLAVVVEERVAAGQLIEEIRAGGGELLQSVEVFDVYTGERLGSGRKSIALSLTFRHGERTLTDEEVTGLHGEIVDRLSSKYAAELRK